MVYTIIFIILCVIAFFAGDKKPGKFVIAILFIFFAFFVGFRGDDVDNDYLLYFKSITIKNYSRIAEFSFKLIADFFYNNFGSTVLFFLFYAVLGVWLKLVGMKKYSNYFWLSMVIYFSTFFILQEMNAIRAGVACGFMLLALSPWQQDDKMKTFMFLLIAVFFHYSFVVLLPLIFFVKNDDKKIFIFVSLIPLAYLLYFIIDIKNIFAVLNVTYVQEKSTAYDYNETETKVLSTVFIIKIIFIALSYIFRKKLADNNEGFYLYLKLYCIGLFMVVVLAKLPAASMRFLDIFIIVELFLLPIFVKLFRKEFRWIPKLLIIAYSSFYLYLYMDSAKYVRDYFFIFDK
ncbi:EpsG family protein [Chryseobacterium oranimense]|uniref:EpsG family protein n=1 Tax=Chryseobacterium oranimense TaxID=421058 RepID=UPI002235FB42|nr:EpsG family protein [Chryseobacterium oranimense]